MRFGDEGELRLCLGSWGQLLPGFTWPLRMHGIIRILSNNQVSNNYHTLLVIRNMIYLANENAWNN